LGVLLLAGAATAYVVALRTATVAYDRSLLDVALALAEQVKIKDGRILLDLPPVAQHVLLIDKYDRLYYLVNGPQGEFIAGHKGLPQPPSELPPGYRIYYYGLFHGEPVRMVALSVALDGSYATVQVAETLVKRDKLIWEILLTMLLPEMLLMAAALGLVWYGVARGLAPIERVREELATRSHRDLRPVHEDRAPDELRPMVHELNKLLDRVGQTVSAQQRFLADAAHQLRTPLAALQAHMDLALRQSDPAEVRHTLQHLHADTARTVHLANQLLALARAEPGGHRPDSLRPVNLAERVEAAAADWVPRAVAKDLDLGFELQPAWVLGEPLLIGELLANLLDNAIRYTPAGGRITARTLVRGDQALLQVEDDGPGIPEGERGKVVERFYRMAGSPGDGCGLGLAIVQEIAHAHDAALALETPPGGHGSLFTVAFPLAANPAPAKPV